MSVSQLGDTSYWEGVKEEIGNISTEEQSYMSMRQAGKSSQTDEIMKVFQYFRTYEYDLWIITYIYIYVYIL